MIKIDKITISYIPEYSTLMNICCELDQNSFISGSIDDGTHSLLRVISKIDTYYHGDIYIDDVNIKQIRDRDLDLAYVPHEPYLFKKDIFSNLYYPLKIRGIKINTARHMIDDIISQYASNMPAKIKKLSHSEKKIIALLRAIIRKPKYVLIEDFFTDLDDKYRSIACNIINAISNTSIIIACDTNLIECYRSYKQYELSYGQLNESIND